MTTKISTANIQDTALAALSGGGTTAYDTLAELPLSGVDAGEMALVLENNRLYIWNGSGWFNIAIINTNPTITSGPNATYSLARDGTPTVLTLVASDPEGIPITWSYQVTSGSLGSTATIEQNNNVFTITPSTNSAHIGTFGVTFTASDGVNIATAASSFTLAFASADTRYNQSIVLTTSSVNNANNNAFIDSSNNNFTITRNGNVTQGTFSPFSPAGWSGYFSNGSITVSSSNVLNFGTGDFTVEFWINLSSYNTTSPGNIIHGGDNGGFGIYFVSNVVQIARYNQGGDLTYNGSAPLNTWSHWAFTRQGNTARIFLNGSVVATGSVSTNYGASSFNLGSAPPVYFSNVRIVKGSALYTANFTPPTDPLTAVAGTSLLTLQDNRFKDNSTNNFTITRNGDTRSTPFSPFLPTVEYSPSVHGGSGYFDGSGDTLTISNSNIVNFGTGDYTVEAWVFPTNTTAFQLLDARPSSTNGAYLALGFAAGSSMDVYVNSTSIITATSFPQLNQWTHIAVSKSAGVTRLFLNGVQTGSSYSDSINYISGSALRIGSNAFVGASGGSLYLSGLRILKGTALYTTNFTPPTASVTAVANTSLLLNFTNAGVYDETGKVVLETVGDAKVSTSIVKYGNSSMVFDGTGDYLLSPSDPVFDFPSNFTIEMWINLANVNSTWQTIISRAYGIAGGWRLYKNDGNNQLRWYSQSSSVVLTTGSTLANNTWHHIAVVRNSGTVTIFIDGINRGSGTNTTAYTPGNYALEIGSGVVTSTFPMTGYISDLRITNGVARYTANFTPPTAKLGYNNAQ